MILLPIIITLLIHCSLKGWKNVLFELVCCFHFAVKWTSIFRGDECRLTFVWSGPKAAVKTNSCRCLRAPRRKTVSLLIRVISPVKNSVLMQRSRLRKFPRILRIKIQLHTKSWKQCVWHVRKKKGLNTSQTKHDANDHGTYASMRKESAHRLRRTFHFNESFDELSGKSAFEMLYSFLYLFSLVCSYEFSYANFSSTCVQCTRLLKSECGRLSR